MLVACPLSGWLRLRRSGSGYPLIVLGAKGACGLTASIPHAGECYESVIA